MPRKEGFISRGGCCLFLSLGDLFGGGGAVESHKLGRKYVDAKAFCVDIEGREFQVGGGRIQKEKRR